MHRNISAKTPMKRKAMSIIMRAALPVLFLVLVVTTFPQYGHWKLDRGCSPKVAATTVGCVCTTATYRQTDRKTQMKKCMHTLKHTVTHTRTRTHGHIRMDAHTHGQTHARSNTNTLSFSLSHTHRDRQREREPLRRDTEHYPKGV